MTDTITAMRQTLSLLGARSNLKWRGFLAQHRFPTAAEKLLADFRKNDSPSQQAYANLFRYFMTGFMTYRSRCGAHADYAGLGSYNGPAMDRLEGFSRIAPLAAAWLHGHRDTNIQLADGQPLDLVAILKAGLLAGTDPTSREYWGRIKHWSQAIVEAADIALVLWLTRAQLWDTLGRDERKRIGDWLIQVNGKRIPDNNWHLFPVQVNAVLAALGAPHDAVEMEQHYQRVKSFYRDQGWFRDGEAEDTPGFDYYDAWSFHYHLQWLRRIAPELDGPFIDQTFREFVATYKYFISPTGFPMLGRSTCYRMAAPVPLVLAQQSHADVVSPGEARRALDVVWQYFIAHGALSRGNVTQGYFGHDPRLLEPYSGPASCLWSLRSLVAAFTLPDEHIFWRARPEPLPVEKGDYRIAIKSTGWDIVGDRASGVVTIETRHTTNPALEPVSLTDRLLDPFSRQPRRPNNIPAKYNRARYVSTSPYNAADEEPT
jgi:hypothetical protein